jgi:Domain of unknown function (DUF4136)
MLKGLATVSLLLGTLAVSSCVSIRADSDFYAQADFSRYKLYTWVGDMPFLVPAGYDIAVSPLNQRRIKEAIESELAVKGFTLAEDSNRADFAVSVTVGARDRISVETYPFRYRGSWGWRRFGFYYGPQVDTLTYREGILAIDVFDQATNQPVWHGWAEKRITNSDRADAVEQIKAGVKAILRDFPPTRATTN